MLQRMFQFIKYYEEIMNDDKEYNNIIYKVINFIGCLFVSFISKRYKILKQNCFVMIYMIVV